MTFPDAATHALAAQVMRTEGDLAGVTRFVLDLERQVIQLQTTRVSAYEE